MSEPIKIEVNQASIETLLKASIASATAEALGKNSKFLIEDLVRRTIDVKENSYSSESKFNATLREAIMQEANGAIRAWMDEHRPEIRRLIYEKLKKHKDLSGKVADSLVAKLGAGINVSLSFVEQSK